MTLVDSDTSWVQVYVPLQKLRWIVIPGVNGDVGSRARIIQDAGGGQIEREGRVIKLLADLDAKGKTARLLIEIKDPFALDESTKINVEDNKALNKLPLLLGSYVKVLFEGQTQSGIFALPEGVLREESKVWVRSAEGRLNIRQVKLLWRADGKAYVQGDLSDGDRIITSRIQLPVEGMKLSLIGQAPSQPKPSNAKHPDPDVASSSPNRRPRRGWDSVMRRQDLYKGSTSWMARNPVAANLLMMMLLIGGFLMSQSINKEVFPQIELDMVTISIAYPGASPEEIERGLLQSIEEAVRPIDGVKKVTSVASEGMASVRVELEEGTNRSKALNDVQSAVDRITSFPEGIETPVIRHAGSQFRSDQSS